MWSCFFLFSTSEYPISLHNSTIEPTAPGNKALSSLLGNSKNQIRKTVLGINKHDPSFSSFKSFIYACLTVITTLYLCVDSGELNLLI